MAVTPPPNNNITTRKIVGSDISTQGSTSVSQPSLTYTQQSESEPVELTTSEINMSGGDVKYQAYVKACLSNYGKTSQHKYWSWWIDVCQKYSLILPSWLLWRVWGCCGRSVTLIKFKIPQVGENRNIPGPTYLFFDRLLFYEFDRAVCFLQYKNISFLTVIKMAKNI